MAGTTWVTKTRYEPMTWLLANGEIITEPNLETTASGRKVRVAGTTDSVFSRELDSLLDRAADNIAAERGTTVWLKNPNDLFLGNLAAARCTKERASLHLLRSDLDATRCWWRFKDPASPYEILVTLVLSTSGAIQHQSSGIYFPYREWGASWSNGTVVYSTASEPCDFVARSLNRSEHHDKFWEYVRDSDEWDWPDLNSRHYPTPRQAVKRALEFIRDIEGREFITVPDMSDPSDPKSRKLEIYASNVSAEFVNEITEYLDGIPTIENALEIYKELLQALKASGIETNDKKGENDFLAALMTGERKSLNIQLSSVSEEGLRVDGNHRLALHLPTGTFVVECDHQNVDRNAVAEKWEEAHTMASLTGEEDRLLAFAKAYAQDKIKTRTENIIRERTS
jgi:hypothetical protein